ncbi:hypothetical protein IFR05_002783 [Cadophora sp. M221]|nr:hypothetical protein IFR05_002783 [Cadophora sp. M221]
MASTNVHSTPGSAPGPVLPAIIPLSSGGEMHLASIVPYDSSYPIKTAVVRAPDASTSPIDGMIKALAARLEARIATEGSILKIKGEDELEGPLVVTIYNKLPLEIQDHIWVFAAMDRPRRVEIENNAITDQFDRVKLQERNPPILLRQVNKHLRNKRPELLGYKSISIMSVVHGKPCNYLFHPHCDILGISRMYQVDSIANNHAKEIMVALKTEEILDKIRFIAVNEHYLCQLFLQNFKMLVQWVAFDPR